MKHDRRKNKLDTILRINELHSVMKMLFTNKKYIRIKLKNFHYFFVDNLNFFSYIHLLYVSHQFVAHLKRIFREKGCCHATAHTF